MIPVVFTMGLLGAAIGSFLNVVVYRVPRGLSVVAPRSACPGCGTEIAARDNVPVLSWVLLRGRCRTCAAPISARYPLVEAGTAIFFGVTALVLFPRFTTAVGVAGIAAATLALAAFLWLAAATVSLALIDLDVHRLPNAIVLPLYVAGAALLTASAIVSGDGAPLVRAGVGAIALGGVYLLLAVAVPGGMGGGDVKLAGALGLYLGWLGWPELAVGSLAAFIGGGLFSIVLLLTRRAGRRTGVPFGPWMLAGAWLGIFAGAPIAAAYLHVMGLGD